MGRPEITEDQREMAVVLIANALRKDAHLRDRARRSHQEGDLLLSGMARRRAEPSQRYVEGMRDLLRVLFPNGHVVADECMEEAYARVMGMSANAATRSPDTPFH